MNCPICNDCLDELSSSGNHCWKCEYHESNEGAWRKNYDIQVVQVGDRRWGWSYETPRPTEAINAAIVEAKERLANELPDM